MILKGLIIVQAAFDDFEGTHHCTNNNDESLQDHQMLSAQ
jgi:hypothetical protein